MLSVKTPTTNNSWSIHFALCYCVRGLDERLQSFYTLRILFSIKDYVCTFVHYRSNAYIVIQKWRTMKIPQPVFIQKPFAIKGRKKCSRLTPSAIWTTCFVIVIFTTYTIITIVLTVQSSLFIYAPNLNYIRSIPSYPMLPYLDKNVRIIDKLVTFKAILQKRSYLYILNDCYQINDFALTILYTSFNSNYISDLYKIIWAVSLATTNLTPAVYLLIF